MGDEKETAFFCLDLEMTGPNPALHDVWQIGTCVLPFTGSGKSMVIGKPITQTTYIDVGDCWDRETVEWMATQASVLNMFRDMGYNFEEAQDFLMLRKGDGGL